jgi:hypothetical protein
MIWLPRWTPESSSVRCGTDSTGGSGGRRFPQALEMKAARHKADKSAQSVAARRGVAAG